MKVSSELARDHRDWGASVRDVVNPIGNAGLSTKLVPACLGRGCLRLQLASSQLALRARQYGLK